MPPPVDLRIEVNTNATGSCLIWRATHPGKFTFSKSTWDMFHGGFITSPANRLQWEDVGVPVFDF